MRGAESRSGALHRSGRPLSPGGDFQLDHTNVFDLAAEAVTRNDRADAGWRAGEDQVAGLQFHCLAANRYNIRHRPDHLGQISLLAYFAIDGEPDPPAVRNAVVIRRDQRAAGGRMIERFRPVPWPAGLLRHILQVAAGQVDADAIAPDMAGRSIAADIHAALADGDHQLDFVMKVFCRNGVGNHGAGIHDRIGRLCEEKGRVALVIAHFADMGGIISPHTKYAPDRKTLLAVPDGDGRDGGQGKREISHLVVQLSVAT